MCVAVDLYHVSCGRVLLLGEFTTTGHVIHADDYTRRMHEFLELLLDRADCEVNAFELREHAEKIVNGYFGTEMLELIKRMCVHG